MDEIAKYRADIDLIDDKIIALFNERSAIVKNVGRSKARNQKNDVCYIRSGREAELIRCIYERFKKGIFPAKAAVQMWRLVICASLSLESDLKVMVTKSDEEIYWLSREYFGNFTPVNKRNNSKAIITDIMKNKTQVGVVSVADKNWWLELPQDIKIFACIPFVLQNDDKIIKALAFARLMPEQTSDDISLFRIKTVKRINSKSIVALLRGYGLHARFLSTQNNNHLIEIDGFINDSHNAIRTMKKDTGFAITWLGAYAVPLTI